MVATQIKESYGSLLNINTDIKDIMTKTENAWTTIFLELFKFLLAEISQDGYGILDFANQPAMTKLYAKAQSEINNRILNARTKYFETPMFKADLSHEIDFIDLTATDDINTRITNPTSDDVLPTIVLSTSTSFEYILRKFSGLFPYDVIPVMAIHPSARSLYRMYKLYKRYVTDERVYVQNENSSNMGTILEISTHSIVNDLEKLLRFYDVSTQQLDDDGLTMLKDIVYKYTSFVMPLIAINTRSDRDLGENFVETVFNIFSNQYSGALFFQRQMFETINAIIQSALGIPLVRFYNLKGAVSTLDLLNPNCKYNTLLFETIGNVLGYDDIANYTKYLETISFPFENIALELTEERESLNAVILRWIRLLLLGLILDRTPGQIGYRSKHLISIEVMLQKLVAMLRSNEEYVVNSIPLLPSVAYHTVASLYMIIRSPTAISNIQERISAVNYEKPEFTIPSHKYGNDMQATYPGVYNDEFITNTYKFLGRNAAAQEHASIAKEIFREHKSFAAMRDIGVRVSEIASYEDALGLLMDVESYLDIIASSSNDKKLVITENADTEQFKLLLLNTRGAMKAQLNQFRPK
jgi:hypothetical protein